MAEIKPRSWHDESGGNTDAPKRKPHYIVILCANRPRNSIGCQWRSKFPQKWRLKIPHFDSRVVWMSSRTATVLGAVKGRAKTRAAGGFIP